LRLVSRLAVPLLSAAVLVTAAAPALADPDRLAILTIGTPGGPALTDAAAPVSILQVSTDYLGYGSWTTLPSDFTLSGVTRDEGHLTVTPDGSLLVAGYGAPAGTPAVATTSSASVPRVVAEVSPDGSTSETTRLSDAFSGGRVTSAVTDDGSRLWVTGDGTHSGASIVTTTLGATSSTPLPSNMPVVSSAQPAGGSLYAGPGYSTAKYPYDAHLYQIGTGLPTNGAQTATVVATGNVNSANTIPLQSVFLDLDGAPGVDTAYLSGAAGFYKLRYNATTAKWAVAGSSGFNGGAVTVVVSGGVAHIYTVSGGGVQEQDDTTPNGDFTPGPSKFVAEAPPGTLFRGIAVLPPTVKPFPRLAFGVDGLANAIGDPTNPTLPASVTDTLQPSGPFTLGGYATDDSGFPDDSMLAPNGFTGAATDANDFRLSFQPHGIGNETLWMTATTPDGRSVSTTTQYAASAATDSTSRFLAGGSDASTGDDAGGGYMLVADDEFNTIGLYPTDRSGLPTRQWDFTAVANQDLYVGGNKAKERDIEASARAGDRIYWVGSNGNGKAGKSAPERNSLYATDVSGSGADTQLAYVGQYLGLQADLVAWDHGNAHGLGADYFGLAASTQAGVDPKASDGSGFSIEGLEFAQGSSSTAYVALRAPLEPASDRHLALVVPIVNFDQLVLGNPQSAVHAQFGAPLLWDLGGLGVREIRRNAQGRYLIIAGSVDAAASFVLYVWDGNPAHAPVKGPVLPAGSEGSNWEGFASVPDTLSPSTTLRLIGDRGDAFIYGGTTDAKDQGALFRTSRTDVFSLAGLPLDQEPGPAAGTVPATLSLTLGAGASFGVFTPGVDRTYTASMTANVISTAGEATLSASDPGHLANGAFSLPSALQVSLDPSAWPAPVANGAVAIGFSQHIGATDALRTGSYAKTLTFTLSTSTP
jgi:hypothetical protein